MMKCDFIKDLTLIQACPNVLLDYYIVHTTAILVVFLYGCTAAPNREHCAVGALDKLGLEESRQVQERQYTGYVTGIQSCKY